MPRFEATVDVDIDEFLNECSPKEIKEVIEYLKDEDYIPDFDLSQKDIKQITYDQELFYKMIGKLSNCYLRLSPEDLDVLKEIAARY